MLPIQEQPGTGYWRVPWTGRRQCPDCGTGPGCTHHLYCERERCPGCCNGQQLISCLRHFLWTALPSPHDDQPAGAEWSADCPTDA